MKSSTFFAPRSLRSPFKPADRPILHGVMKSARGSVMHRLWRKLVDHLRCQPARAGRGLCKGAPRPLSAVMANDLSQADPLSVGRTFNGVLQPLPRDLTRRSRCQGYCLSRFLRTRLDASTNDPPSPSESSRCSDTSMNAARSSRRPEASTTRRRVRYVGIFKALQSLYPPTVRAGIFKAFPCLCSGDLTLESSRLSHASCAAACRRSRDLQGDSQPLTFGW